MVVETGTPKGRGDKLPPHDVDAEEAVIASLLVDPDAIYKVAPRLKPEDFFREKNGWIYEACRTLWDRSESINQITVGHELSRSNRLEDIGGISYISRLVTDLPTAIGVEYYAEIVQRDAVYRRVISAAGEIARHAYVGGADVADVRSRAELLLTAAFQSDTLRDFVHIRELLQTYLESAEALTGPVASSSRTITTGFADLDTLLGFLKRGDLVVVAARPSLGKTSLVLNFASGAAARQGARVAFFSIEMAATQLVERMIAMESGVDSARLNFGHHSERDERKISQALGALGDLAIYFDDSAGLTVAEMRSKARQLQRERGDLDLIVVDYLQLMQSGMRNENRVQEVSYISRSLKQLARDLDVPVIACSQLSRAAEMRASNVPQLSDLRESGSIEQDADVVMFIYREDKYISREQWEKQHADRPREYPSGITQIIVAKHRNGPTGTIHLRFKEKLARFDDLLVRDDDGPDDDWGGPDS